MSAPAPFDVSGRLLDRYEYVDKLGEGGMGIAYLCRTAIQVTHTDRGLEFVVKVPRLSAGGIEPGMLEMVLEEFDTLRKFDHANIVKVVDFGVVDRIPFMVLNYLRGQTLAARRKRTAGRDCDLSWLLPIAKALDYAHSKQVFHRDVKPSNIIFDDGGNPHVLDFGIARCVQAGLARGPGGSGFSGTVQFCAPEDDRTSRRADQYSLAATVHHWLTGEWTHRFGQLSLMEALELKRNVTPAPLPHVVPGLPTAAPAALARALAVAPAARFPTCSAFARAFLGLPPEIGDDDDARKPMRDGSEPRPLALQLPGFTALRSAPTQLPAFVHDRSGVEFLLVRGGWLQTEGDQEPMRVGPFLLARRPVSWRQWKAWRAPKRSATDRMDDPVDRVTWHEANEFCHDHGLVLPTERQWEFACVCGEPTLTPVAADGTIARANAWGFEDMLGAVHQWCADSFGPGRSPFHALRGGCRIDRPERCSPTTRHGLSPHSEVDFVGFRPAFGVSESSA